MLRYFVQRKYMNIRKFYQIFTDFLKSEQIPTTSIKFDQYLSEPNSKSIYFNPTDSKEILTI